MNKIYFKDLREKATAETLNNSELVYNGYRNDEYIRRQLRAFIGKLTNYATIAGVDTVYPLDGHDTSFTITMKAADRYVKAYRSQAKYDDAIVNISGLFDKYDSHYFENDLVEDDDDDIFLVEDDDDDLFGDFEGEPLTEEELEQYR